MEGGRGGKEGGRAEAGERMISGPIMHWPFLFFFGRSRFPPSPSLSFPPGHPSGFVSAWLPLWLDSMLFSPY